MMEHQYVANVNHPTGYRDPMGTFSFSDFLDVFPPLPELGGGDPSCCAKKKGAARCDCILGECMDNAGESATKCAGACIVACVRTGHGYLHCLAACESGCATIYLGLEDNCVAAWIGCLAGLD